MTLTTSYLYEIKKMMNYKSYKINFPEPGDITYYAQDNKTVLFVEHHNPSR